MVQAVIKRIPVKSHVSSMPRRRRTGHAGQSHLPDFDWRSCPSVSRIALARRHAVAAKAQMIQTWAVQQFIL